MARLSAAGHDAVVGTSAIGHRFVVACGVAAMGLAFSVPALRADATELDEPSTARSARVEVDDAGISIQYPRTWVDVPTDEDGWRKQRARYIKRDPKYHKIFALLSFFDRALKFRAVDLESKVTGYGGFVGVSVDSTFVEPSLDRAVHKITNDVLADVDKVSIISASKAARFGSHAYRVDWRETTPGSRGNMLYTKHNAQLVFERNGHTVRVFIECLDDDDSCAPLIDTTFDSIKLR